MYDVLEKVRIIFLILLEITLIFAMVCTVKYGLIPFIQIREAEGNISAGEIVDKEVINARYGFFTSNNMDYRLVIEGKFEYKGETITGKRSISVDKETYQSANVGDWFDSHALTITKKE